MPYETVRLLFTRHRSFATGFWSEPAVGRGRISKTY